MTRPRTYRPTDLDRKILRIIQDDFKPFRHISRQLGSQDINVRTRVVNMNLAGALVGCYADINLEPVGYKISFYAIIGLEDQDEANLKKFEDLITTIPEIREYSLMANGGDFILKMVARNFTHFNELTMMLTNQPLIKRVRTLEVVRTSTYRYGCPV